MVTAQDGGEVELQREPLQSNDPDLAAAVRTRASEVFGRQDAAVKLAQDEAFKLWLAWRGDPSYLIVNLSDRVDRESVWRVVNYASIAELAGRHNYIEARGMGSALPDHVLARFTRFALGELNRTPGAEAEMRGSEGDAARRLPLQAVAEEAFRALKKGEVMSIRWPSKGAPGLYSRILVLSRAFIQDSKYPALDMVTNTPAESDRHFSKFLEQSERKRQKRWVKWVTHG